MERKLEKMAQLIREDLGSVKMMILSIMMSFGLVLSVVYFVVNMFSTLETVKYMSDYMKSPYDAELNGLISTSVNVAFIAQVVAFFASFIPLVLMTWGIYLIYINAKSDEKKLTGLKLTGGVIKYHGVMAFVTAGLIIVGGVLLVVLSNVYGDDIALAMGDTSGQMTSGLVFLAVICMIVLIFVSLFFVGKGVVIMTLAGNLKHMRNVLENAFGDNVIKRMSLLGMAVLLIAGGSNLLDIFSSITSVGMSPDDVELLEEMLGGEAAHMLIDAMPSKIIQFETMVITVAYKFFIGVAQVLGAVVLISIRSKVNRVLEEQEVVNYGGDDFFGSN